MTLTIYLVRHGQTLFNVRRVVQGWVDSPLTELGWAQAQAAAEALRARPIRAVYSSTSERAIDTAEVIARYHGAVAVRPDRGFKELYFGQYEALPNDEVMEAITPVEEFFPAMIGGTHPGLPGGESGASYRARVHGALERVIAENPDGGEVVIVSHGVTINALLVHAGWHSPGPMENASISVLRHRRGLLEWVAVGLPDISSIKF